MCGLCSSKQDGEYRCRGCQNWDWKGLCSEAIVEKDRVRFILKKSIALRAITRRLQDPIEPEEQKELRDWMARLRDLTAAEARKKGTG